MTISALPTPPSRLSSPTEFASQADALLNALPQFVTQTNATVDDFNSKKTAFDTSYAAAVAAGLPNAASNATTAREKAIEASASATTASAKALEATAAWSAALASNPDLNPIFRMNPSSVTEDFAVPENYNAFSAGPLSISDGVTVTLNDNATWSIL